MGLAALFRRPPLHCPLLCPLGQSFLPLAFGGAQSSKGVRGLHLCYSPPGSDNLQAGTPHLLGEPVEALTTWRSPVASCSYSVWRVSHLPADVLRPT